MISAEDGGAERRERESSAPPLPSEVRGSSTPLRSDRNDYAFARALRFILALTLAGAVARGIEPAKRAEFTERFQAAIERADGIISRDPTAIEAYSRRGDARLLLGKFKEAVADFEKMIALDASQDAPHWRLGIAYYFAGDFAKSARQFEKYHAYDARDRENGIWKFLAQAKLDGIEKARAEMLKYTQFDREAFPALYEMFAGKRTGDEVLAHAASKPLSGDKRVQFFAHYYVGLNEELLGRREAAREHLRKALAQFEDDRATDGPGYMWQVARVHLETLAKPPAP